MNNRDNFFARFGPRKNLEAGMTSSDPYTSAIAYKNPLCTKDELHSAIKTGNYHKVDCAISNINADQSHVDAVIANRNPDIQHLAIKHGSDELLNNIMQHGPTELRVRAMNSPNVKERHLKLGINDPEDAVVQATVSSEKATPEVLTHGIRHKNISIVMSAMRNANMTKKIAEEGENHPDKDIARAVSAQMRKGRYT